MRSTARPVRGAEPDRRAALKARHRAAILDAARSLIDEQGGPGFGVEELAARADVARRTVFNHFASLDEILLTLCADALDVIIDDVIEAATVTTPVGDGSRAALFDEVSQMLRQSDLPSAIASITRILGEPDADDPKGRALSDEAFARAAERLLQEVLRRNPGVDALDAELLVTSLMSGLIVVAKHWVLGTGVRLDEVGRAEWQRLLGRLTDSVRSGYAPVH